jgi:hypothetical protein
MPSNKAVLAKFKELWNNAEYNTEYQIPYLAGYNLDGSVVYLDSDVAQAKELFKYWKYLFIHELSEKAYLLVNKSKYQEAHKHATQQEKNALTRDRLDWDEYSAALEPFIKECEEEQIEKIPPDFDTEPYTDSHDKRVLEKLKAEKEETDNDADNKKD